LETYNLEKLADRIKELPCSHGPTLVFNGIQIPRYTDVVNVVQLCLLSQALELSLHFFFTYYASHNYHWVCCPIGLTKVTLLKVLSLIWLVRPLPDHLFQLTAYSIWRYLNLPIPILKCSSLTVVNEYRRRWLLSAALY